MLFNLIALVFILVKKISTLSTVDQNHLKGDCINGCILDGCRQPIAFNFNLDKPAVYNVLCGIETYHYIKINKPVLNTISFYLEYQKNEEGNFNGETLTFTSQLIKI